MRADGLPGEPGPAETGPAAASPFNHLEVADLQDHLLSAATDLGRLQTLLTDASEALLAHFASAHRHLERFCGEDGSLMSEAPGLAEIRTNLGSAITALQFHDMASQLITHTVRRLHNVADRLAADVMTDDGEEAALIEAPLRANPVTQAEMEAGSIELF